MKTRVRRLCLRAVGEPVQNSRPCKRDLRTRRRFEETTPVCLEFSFTAEGRAAFCEAKTRKHRLAICDVRAEFKISADRSLRFLRSVSHTKTKSTRPIGQVLLLVRETGLEPVHQRYTPLKRARLPIPPLPQNL